MAAAGRVGTFESTLPITSLTLGQFRGGKAVRVVALFALVPILLIASLVRRARHI